MSDIFNEVYKLQQTASVTKEAPRSAEKVASTTEEIIHLKTRFERLLLVNAALWELLKTKLDINDTDLKAMMLEVDAQDGKIDGRFGAVTRTCAKCSKVLHPKHATCMYCGHDNGSVAPIAQV